MTNINLDLDSLKKLNSNEPANITDIIVNVMTLVNIATTLIAVINERTGNVAISDLFYNISSFLIIFAITISLIFKMLFKKKKKNTDEKSKHKKLNKTDKMINDLDIKNLKKIRKYNITFFIVLIINIIIAILAVVFERINKILLSNIFYDINSYIIIGVIIPILIYGLILKYKIKRQNSSLLNNIFEHAYKSTTKKSKNIIDEKNDNNKKNNIKDNNKNVEQSNKTKNNQNKNENNNKDENKNNENKNKNVEQSNKTKNNQNKKDAKKSDVKK